MKGCFVAPYYASTVSLSGRVMYFLARRILFLSSVLPLCFLGLWAGQALAALPLLELPIRCPAGHNCFSQNYFDFRGY